MGAPSHEDELWDALRAAGLVDHAPSEQVRELVALLAERQFPVDELRRTPPGSLAGVLGDRLIRVPGERLTIAEAAERLGVDAGDLRRAWRATGLPDPGDAPAVTPDDLANFELAFAGAELFGLEPILGFLRVLGASLSRLAEAAVALFMAEREEPLMEAGGSLADLAQANEVAVTALMGVPGVMETLFRHHMEAALAHFRSGRTDPAEYRTLRTAVTFVDLVGSTELSRRVGARGFAASIAAFEQIVADTVADHGGRLVKLIGDEALVVALDRMAAVELGRSIRAAVEAHADLGACRVGIAYGDPVAQGGDYFGPVVNLAARLVQAAEPGQILVDAATAEAAGASAAGERHLAGFDDPVPVFEVP